MKKSEGKARKIYVLKHPKLGNIDFTSRKAAEDYAAWMNQMGAGPYSVEEVGRKK